jgi:hypothetical protein
VSPLPADRRAHGRRSRLTLAACVLAIGTTAAAAALSTAASAPAGGQRVDMRVLLLANTPGDGDATAWEDNLEREGTPYTRINATDPPLSAATFSSGDHANYQAVIVAGANGTQPSGRADGFTDAEWALLRAFEQRFGIRQLDVNAVPGPPLGLNFAGSTGSLDGQTATLTAAGLAQFPSLKGTVPFENLDAAVSETFGASATPCDGVAVATCNATSFETLLQSAGGGALLGIAQTKDDREEMVATFSANQFQLHDALLRHELLSWVTGGVYIGLDRNYLSMDVDDIFLPDDKWNPATDTTPEGTAPGQQDLRMSPADVDRLVAFQTANGVKLNMLFNANGINDASGVDSDHVDPAQIAADPLASAILAQKNQFNWINHTWSHPSLGSPNPEVPDAATIESEISRNVAFAAANGLSTANPLGQGSFNPTELVTGEHSGIGTSRATALGPVVGPNPNMAAALNAEGVTTIGADNSREVGERLVGNAYTLPRYPMNVFYNVASWADQLDEYDWIYLDKSAAYVDPPPGGVAGVPAGTAGAGTAPRGNCTPPPAGLFDCFSTPVTQAQFIQRESAALVANMLGNDPRPHYAHQTNLISDPNAALPVNRGDGILYAVLSAALANYRSHMTTSFQQPGMTALREVLRRQVAWGNTSRGLVSGFIQDGKVTIAAAVPRDVPITGTTAGDVVGGRRSGWFAAPAGTTTLDLDQPRNTVAPVISGSSTVGSTLTATDGTFTGTLAPVITSRRWQRSTAGGAWTSIPGATSATYVVTTADRGQQLRFVTTAANRRATWGMGLSAPFAIPGPIVAAPPPPATDAPAPVAPAPGTVAPAPTAPGPAAAAPAAGLPLRGAAVARAAFTCTVKRGARVSLACKVRDTSGGLRTARIRAVRGTRVLATASGRVRRGNQVPVLRLRRTARRQDTRITITVRRANGKLRSMTRTLRI